MKWVKSSNNNFPNGKCLVVCLEPFFGYFTLEIKIGYYDNPNDYDDNNGKGWLDWYSDKEIKVTHFMELPEINFDLVEPKQKEFQSKFNLCEFGIVPNEAIKIKE